ncbi:MAG: hypothetical protein IT444_07745 [Phycisphaeraceae bacterium]|nr:hypothetical protein [Phycisphaeraceae bacterium]
MNKPSQPFDTEKMAATTRSMYAQSSSARRSHLPMLRLSNPSVVAVVAVILLGIICRPVLAQGSAVKVAARELIEAIIEKGGKEAAEDIVRFGGEGAVREVLEKAVREGGESLAERAVLIARSQGVDALRVIDRAPARWVSVLEEIPKDALRPAILAARREPELMTRLVTTYGKEAAEVAARHPGIGTKLVDQLGKDGIELGMRLSDDQAMILARHSDDIAKLVPTQRSEILAKISRSPRAVLEFLEHHPKVLATAAGVGVVLAVKDQVLGPAGEVTTLPDGTVVTPAPGMFERFADRAAERFHQPIYAIFAVIALLIFAWGAVQVWHVWRVKRIKQASLLQRRS